MSHSPGSGKHPQHDPQDPDAPAEKKKSREGASQSLQRSFDDLDEKRKLKHSRKDNAVVVTQQECKVLHTEAQNADLKKLAKRASEYHPTPPLFYKSTYDLLVFPFYTIREYEKIAKGKLTTPRESLDAKDQRILDELRAYGKKAAQDYRADIRESAWHVENAAAAEAIKTRRAELKKGLLAGEKVEDKLSECREIVRTFDLYVLRPKMLSDFESTIQWEAAHARDWATPLGEYIKILNKSRTMSPEDVFPKAKELIEKAWGEEIEYGIKKIMDDLEKRELDQPQPKLPKQEREDSGGHWVLLERQLERMRRLRRYYIKLDDMSKSKTPLTAPNKLMVSLLKVYLVKQAKSIRNRLVQNRTPMEIIEDRVRKVAGKIREHSEEKKQLIDMMCHFGDRVGEEDICEIEEETLCFETLRDVEARVIQAKYVSGLMKAYKKRFPDTAWFYPADIVLTA